MNPPVFELRVPRLRAARRVTVATDVTLAAGPGDVIAVEGPNGSGKTTLLAAAAGLLPGGNATVRPASVSYSPERAALLPRISVLRWLVDLARTAGLSRRESVARAGDVLRRLGLEAASGRSLHVLSRGNTQRALVAQALVSEPDLVILDEPAGGLDGDGVTRVATEISRVADRGAVVLVARHPTAPLPLPCGTTWRFADGTVRSIPREEAALSGGVLTVETGDGVIRQVTEAGLPEVLRAALDAGIAIRRVEPAVRTDVPAGGLGTDRADAPPAVSRRAGTLSRVAYGAAHRARLLAVSQWFAAPLLVFLAVLSILYATDAGPPLQPAAVTAIALIPVMAWLTVLAHRVDGKELARAFATHVGGRARAHLAADLGVVPFAIAVTAAAIIWPLASQEAHQHPGVLVLRMTELHLAAALFGIGLGSLFALIERIGWRLIAAIAVFLGLAIVRGTPLTPLLKLSTAAVTNATPVATQLAWLAIPAILLTTAAATLTTRLY
jgi:ABC-type Mn2+/Zn2+ transport system ATPase subunit